MVQDSQDSEPDTSWYRDDKGRKRWRRNDEVAAIVKQLGEYLIIGGYGGYVLRDNRVSLLRWYGVVNTVNPTNRALPFE